MVYTDQTDLITILIAIAILRLHKILNRVHNGKQLSNVDMAMLALWFAASFQNAQLMRLAAVTVLTYGCATWICRWVVAEARRKDKLEEEEDAESVEEDADITMHTNTPRSRSGSVVLHGETDPDMPPLIDASDEEARTEPYVAPDNDPAARGWMHTVTDTHAPHTCGVMGVSVDEYLSELSYQSACNTADVNTHTSASTSV